MCNINVAVVLFDEDVLAYLVAVDVCAVELESEDELFEFGLEF